jgi:hypothetical protein
MATKSYDFEDLFPKPEPGQKPEPEPESKTHGYGLTRKAKSETHGIDRKLVDKFRLRETAEPVAQREPTEQEVAHWYKIVPAALPSLPSIILNKWQEQPDSTVADLKADLAAMLKWVETLPDELELRRFDLMAIERQ